MNLFHDLKLGNEDLTELNAIIEIPKGSQVKYEFDKALGCIMVDRIGRTPMAYNFNYGLLPQTWNKEDNDPLDIVVLSKESFVPGCVVPCRVIGGLKMIDSGEFDYKVVAVADDKFYDNVKDIEDLDENEKEDIYYYMQHYKDLHGKTVVLEGWDNKEAAIKVTKDCQNYYPVKFQK